VNRDFDRDFPIKTWLGDVWSEGSGTAKGKVAMDFASAKLEEPLPIRVAGTMFSRAKSYAGPVVTTSRTDTTFEAVFSFDFDGKKFIHSSSWVKADCDSTIESICATTRIGRRLIQRVAWRVAPGRVSRFDYTAARKVEAEIDDAARDAIQSSLEELNKAIGIEHTLTVLAASDGYRRVVSKTGSYIQVHVASEGDEDLVPPSNELLSDSQIEIWIHPNTNRPLLAELAVRLGTTQEVLRQLLPGIPQSADAPSIEVIGDWDVIKLGRLPVSPLGSGPATN